MNFLTDLSDVVSADQLAETVEGIAEWQLASGMIPWSPGGHSDPWNHVEAAMALDLGGRRAAAEAAYQWLVDIQRPDGAWHQYYVADAQGRTIVEQDKLDANVCAYVAAGVWHHWLLTGDGGFVETMWPVVERAIDFVLELQQPRGEILWARHADGTPWSFALLTGSSSICHSLRCAIAHRGAPRPRASRLGTVGRSPRRRGRPTSRRCSSRSIAGPWTGTTRCSPASCWATTAARAWRSVSTCS